MITLSGIPILLAYSQPNPIPLREKKMFHTSCGVDLSINSLKTLKLYLNSLHALRI